MMDLSANEFIRMLHSTSVTIIVKHAHDADFQISLPKHLLTAKCSRFGELVDGQANDNFPAVHPTFMPQSGVVISGHSAQAFKIFTPWLYNNILPSRVEEHDHPAFRPLINLSRSRIRDFLEAWLLFDYLRLPEQQSMAMHQMRATVDIIRHAGDMIYENDFQLVAQNRQHTQLYLFTCEVLMMCVMGGALDADKVRGVLMANGMPTDVMEHLTTAASPEEFQQRYLQTQIAAWSAGHTVGGLEAQI